MSKDKILKHIKPLKSSKQENLMPKSKTKQTKKRRALQIFEKKKLQTK